MTDKIYQSQLERFGIEATAVNDRFPKEKDKRLENRLALQEAVRDMTSTVQGRHWLYEKLEMCQVFGCPFSPKGAEMTAFLAGAQAVGQVILKEIFDIAPDKFILMTQEASQRMFIREKKQESASSE